MIVRIPVERGHLFRFKVNTFRSKPESVLTVPESPLTFNRNPQSTQIWILYRSLKTRAGASRRAETGKEGKDNRESRQSNMQAAAHNASILLALGHAETNAGEAGRAVVPIAVGRTQVRR